MQPPARPGTGQAARSGQGASSGAGRAGPGAARKHLNTKVLSGVLRQVKNNVPKNYLAPFMVSMYAGRPLPPSVLRDIKLCLGPAAPRSCEDGVRMVCSSYRLCSHILSSAAAGQERHAQPAASVPHAYFIVLRQSP